MGSASWKREFYFLPAGTKYFAAKVKEAVIKKEEQSIIRELKEK